MPGVDLFAKILTISAVPQAFGKLMNNTLTDFVE